MRRSDTSARIRELEGVGREAAANARFAETLRTRVTGTGAIAYQMREAFLNTTGKSGRLPARAGDGRTFPVVGSARLRPPDEAGRSVKNAQGIHGFFDPTKHVAGGLAAWVADKPD